MTQLGSIEAVVAAVQEDAKAEIETIERETAATIERLRTEDAGLPVVVPDADARVAAARRLARDLLAAEDWADREAALSRRERWIQQVTAEGQRRLAALDTPALRVDLVDLVREAMAGMPNEPLELLVPATERDFVEKLRGDGSLAGPGKVVARVGVTAEIASGCIVQTATGRIRYENSYGSRARRYEPVWRARLGELYEQRPEAALAGLPSSPTPTP